MKDILSDSYYFARTNLSDILKIVGPTFLLVSIIGALVGSMSYSSVAVLSFALLQTAALSFVMCRLIKYMASKITNQQADLTVTLPEWGRLVVVYIVYGFVVLIGFIALIIPGIYLTAKYAFVDFEIVLNKQPTFKSFGISWQLTKGYVFKLALIVALIGGAQLLLASPLGYLSDLSVMFKIVSEFTSYMLSFVSMAFMSVVYFRVYVLALDSAPVIKRQCHL